MRGTTLHSAQQEIFVFDPQHQVCDHSAWLSLCNDTVIALPLLCGRLLMLQRTKWMQDFGAENKINCLAHDINTVPEPD